MADSIRINKPQEKIIIEKLEGKTIQAGSHLYCGMCGHTLGTVINNISMPFNSRQLVENMHYRTFIHGYKLPNSGKGLRGLVHATCGESMFVQSNMWDFIGLDEYNRKNFPGKIILLN